MTKKSNIEPGRVTKRHADRRTSQSESNKICHSQPIDGFPNKLLTREIVKEAVANGSGPNITFTMDRIGGAIDAEGVYEKASNEIKLRGASLDRIEAILKSDASEEVKQKALLPLFMTVAHETVHYGDYLDGSKYDGGYEIGDEYENRVWTGSTFFENGKESVIYGVFNTRGEELQHAYEKNPDALPTVPKKDE